VNNAIVDKVRHELERGIDTEVQVVYVLVEIRKLIEHSERRARYKPLKFYCDWALHPTLDRKSAREFLREIDDAIERRETNEQAAKRMGAKFSLEAFRVELIHFLIDHRLPVDPIRTAAPWITFLRRYLETISDCPIQSHQPGFKHVDAVVLKASHEPPTESPNGVIFVYTLRWTFYKNNEEVFTWANEVYRAGANG
jgi:hypothetical protein